MLVLPSRPTTVPSTAWSTPAAPRPRRDPGPAARLDGREDGVLPELLEVRLLGRFSVRGESGAVAADAWRTCKTRDLFRLLALAHGRMVPVDTILDALWPDAPPERGRASLRTAASQLRRVVGETRVVREAAGLGLTGAWVDAHAFTATAEIAERALRRGDAAAGVSAAWEALNLYAGDLCEDAPYADWAVAERGRLHGLLRAVLLDACDAACEIGWLRDAAELGHRALQLEPSSERAHRGLMRTYWRLGETEQAFRLYEQCRQVLADELGVDPGVETQAVHLELLRCPPVDAAQPPLVGRDVVLTQLRDCARAVIATRRPRGVLITGAPGSGRSRLVEQAVQGWPHRRVDVQSAAGALISAADVEQQIADHVVGGLDAEPTALVLQDVERLDAGALALVRDLLERSGLPLLVLATAGDEPPGALDRLAGHWESVVLPPLTQEEAASLLQSVLHAAPSPRLAAELHEGSAGNPAALLATGRQLLAAGQLVLTVQGMARVDRVRGQGPSHVDQRLTAARAGASELACQALDLLTVLDRPLPGGELARLLDVSTAELRPALDPLIDHLVLRSDRYGYALRDALIREAAYRWLRPSTRRRLHEAVAGLALLPSDVRAEQWLLAGEPALACAAALEAAHEALLRGDHAKARAQLLMVRSHADRQDLEPTERIGLLERLADESARLGRRLEARTLLEEAVVLSRRGAPAALARLHIALGRLAANQADALVSYTDAATPTATSQDQRQISLAVAAATSGRTPEVAARLLRQTVRDADASGDLACQVRARVLLSRASAQQRDLDRASTTARSALALAEAAGDEELFVRAGHAVVQPAVFLGDGMKQLPLLRRLRARSLELTDPVLRLEVGLSVALALHELGAPGFFTAWQSLDPLTGLGRTRLHRLVTALVDLERGRLAQAERLLHELPGQLDAVVADHATQVLHARLLAATGDPGGAVAALCGVVGDTDHRAVRLLLPEAGARLAELLAPQDARAAQAELERALAAARGALHPREQICVLRARAALLLAEGQPRAAHSVLIAATLTAQRTGLVFQEAEVHELRADLLQQLGSADAAVERDHAAALRARACDGAA